LRLSGQNGIADYHDSPLFESANKENPVMSVTYAVSKATLRGTAQYVGRTVVKESYTQDMIVSRMLGMRTSLSKEEIESVLSLFEKTVYTVCREGNKVTLENFMQFTPAIGGTFDGAAALFDRAVNSVYVTAQISPVFNRRFNRETPVDKVTAREKKPALLEITDNNTGTVNAVITQNDIVTIHGDKMKYSSADPEEYLRFVNAQNPSQYAEITRCQKITDREIVFLMPEVAFTSGYFEIGTKRGTCTLRTGKSLPVYLAQPDGYVPPGS
jgi:hypothetical protein